MCELLAMSARFPTTLRLSLDELARHGGGTGPHADGWGIAAIQDGDAFVIREPEAAHGSAWVRLFEEREVRCASAIAHVRKATQGARALRNTQPFARELGGSMHVFAHNGMLSGIETDPRFVSRRFRRVGETDSEHAFCALLERLAPLWEEGTPSVDARVHVMTSFAADLRALGPANFLYSDGELLVAHGHKRHHPDGQIRAPGLHILRRRCTCVEDAVPRGAGVNGGEDAGRDALQSVALIASVPLSAEPWEPLGEGDVVVLRGGSPILRVPARAAA